MAEPSAPSPFASRSLGRHMLRGLVGAAATLIALPLFFLGQGWPAMAGAVLFGAISVVAFRGCVLCWMVGLVETAIRGWRGRRTGACRVCTPAG
jgi:hypothetical protein